MEGSSRARGRGRDAATLLGVTGLLVTLVFNTLAVRQGTKQSVEARETAQIGLIAQLNSNATDTERALGETPAPQRQCDRFVPLKASDDAAVRAVLDYYEYISWLFNHGRLTVASSREFFGGRMIAGWRLARHYLGSDQLAGLYPELTAFVRETPRRQLPPNVCAAAS
jgi:hypothetical protein